MDPHLPSNPTPGRPRQIPRNLDSHDTPVIPTVPPLSAEAAKQALMHTRAVDRNLPIRAPTDVKESSALLPNALPVELELDVDNPFLERSLALPGWVWFLGTLAGLLAGLILLRLYTEVLGAIIQIATLPSLAAYGLSFFLVLILTWILFVVYRLARDILSLRPGRVIKLKQVRGAPFTFNTQAARKARTYLEEDYLPAFKQGWFAGGRDEFRTRLGEANDVLARIEVAVAAYTEKRILDSTAWIEAVEVSLLRELDDVARRRCRLYAKRVGLKTAIAPWRFLDTCAVLYNSLQLVRDLGLIYNRRTTGLSTILLLGNIMVNTYIAGEAGDVLENMADNLDGEIDDGVADTIGSSLVGKIIPKVAEGLTSALLVLRLGRRTMVWLRPLQMR